MFNFLSLPGRKLQTGAILLLFCLMAALTHAQDGYISARNFAESQGIAHQWFPIQQILVMRKGLKSVKFKLGDQTAIVDDKEFRLPAPPKIQDGQLMVPAVTLNRIFLDAAAPVTAPIKAPQPQIPQPIQPPPGMVPIAQTPAPQQPVSTLQNEPPQISIDDSSESVLLALRHSSREDHTRVVLEFSAPVTHRSEFKDGTYKITFAGCRNLIPTKRTNPVGRDLTRLDINSGPDRKGLILNFVLPQKEKTPTIETVASPFRIIVSLPSPGEQTPPASATAQVASQSLPAATQTSAAKPAQAQAPKVETAPEINIEVETAALNNSSFAGRTIIIDPGHGGNDRGYVFAGRPDEKTINLSVAQHLKARLEQIGFKAVLTRTTDEELTHPQRISFANRSGGDLYISIHTGGSNDSTKAGISCYYFTTEGSQASAGAQGAAHDAAFSEWSRNTRFDLALFLAKKLNDRLIQHLKVESRGIRPMPVLPVKFIMNPAVTVEVGMLSDKTEGKNLISDKYRQAVANSIANAVVDFFNGIVIKQ